VASTPDPHPYAALTPDAVLRAVDSIGMVTDGRLLALNSYENRVYQVGIEGEQPVVAKFYRPGRWTDAAIREEHAFARELAEADIPVVPPMVRDSDTLFTSSGFRFGVWPRAGGHWPELSTKAEWAQMGRTLGRIHGLGASGHFAARTAMGCDAAELAVDELLDEGWIPQHLETAYATLTDDLLEAIREAWERVGPRMQRIHGDCHPGNVLWTDAGPHLVDLDDCISGPVIQDLWLFLSGEREERQGQLAKLMAGYTSFAELDPMELHLIEPLRAMRMIRYAAWLAERWDDPAFPQAFPWFGDDRYWDDHVLSLREQLGVLQEPVLQV
jgi:Ser/Thr protein kinase RdoA (MazF antagonist)